MMTQADPFNVNVEEEVEEELDQGPPPPLTMNQCLKGIGVTNEVRRENLIHGGIRSP